MISIDDTQKRIDWNTIRAEYIGGGTSYRKLAVKYSVSASSVGKHAREESWQRLREEAVTKASAISVQKTAEIASDNAEIAERIRGKLLLRLEREIDALPEGLGSETRKTWGLETDGDRAQETVRIYRLRDFASVLLELINAAPDAWAESDTLREARELLGGIDSAF